MFYITAQRSEWRTRRLRRLAAESRLQASPSPGLLGVVERFADLVRGLRGSDLKPGQLVQRSEVDRARRGLPAVRRGHPNRGPPSIGRGGLADADRGRVICGERLHQRIRRFGLAGTAYVAAVFRSWRRWGMSRRRGARLESPCSEPSRTLVCRIGALKTRRYTAILAENGL